jgi:hypothetical protein
MNKQTTERDAFISYASEERESVAKPLAELLTTLGISVWLDKFDLKIGDSLRRKIDEGLASCRFGIVLLSPSFFGKHYTNRELDGLAQREVDGTKVILPVWIGVDEQEVRKFSPPLADRIAARWEDGIATVVMQLIEVIKPEVLTEIRKKEIITLGKVNSGKEMMDIVIGSHFSFSYHDEVKDETEIDLVGGFIQNMRDWADIWDDIDVPGQMRAVLNVDEMLRDLSSNGWSVYAARMKGKRKLAGAEGTWTWNAIAVFSEEPDSVVFADDQFFIYRPERHPTPA